MYPEKPNNSTSKALASIIIIIAVALISLSVNAYDNKQKTASRMPQNTTSIMPPASSPMDTAAGSAQSMKHSSPASTYKDGTYTARANYFVPHGYESITVTLSVKSGVITNSSIQNSESDPESARFQQDFASQYKGYVVGKSIASLHLPYIAGASDTAQGFDNAVLKIQNQAQA